MGVTQSSVLEEVIVEDHTKMNIHLPSGETLLTACIQDKDIQYINRLFTANVVDSNYANKYGDTPLMSALRTKNVDIVKTILKQEGTDVNKVGRFQVSPIQLATVSGNNELVKLLLSHGANPNGVCPGVKYNHPRNYSTPLQIAIQDEELSRILMDHGASVNIGCPLLEAIEKRSIEVAKQILNNDYLDVDFLNKQKTDVLTAAARMHNCELVQGLLQKGCIIRKFDDESSQSNREPYYTKEVGPLGYAIHYGCWNCFQSLLKHTEDLNQKDTNNLTAIDYALFVKGWHCSSLSDKNQITNCHTVCLDRGYKSEPPQLMYRPISFRLKYLKELLNRGADFSDVWNKAIWSHVLKARNEYESKALRFSIRVFHGANKLKSLSMFRNIARTNDMVALSLVYMDGYNPTIEDITVVENNINHNELIDSNDNTAFSKNRLSLLLSTPRTLKNLAVITIRENIGPNIYEPVQNLPIPKPLQKVVLFEDVRGMIPTLS